MTQFPIVILFLGCKLCQQILLQQWSSIQNCSVLWLTSHDFAGTMPAHVKIGASVHVAICNTTHNNFHIHMQHYPSNSMEHHSISNTTQSATPLKQQHHSSSNTTQQPKQKRQYTTNQPQQQTQGARTPSSYHILHIIKVQERKLTTTFKTPDISN